MASLRIPSLSVKESSAESENELPRSTSATSSLDPYYFTIPSHNGSPVPPLPVDVGKQGTRSPQEPSTPARDPALIDRNDLVGVGELRTPRWPKLPSSEESLSHFATGIHVGGKSNDVSGRDESDEDNDRDSPWTIEAVDGEQDDFEVSEAEFH